jgi:hypothetical protein
VAAAADNPAVATSALRKALDGFEMLGAAFEVARTQERLAEVVGGREARLLREAALAAYESIGAAPCVERLRVALV